MVAFKYEKPILFEGFMLVAFKYEKPILFKGPWVPRGQLGPQGPIGSLALGPGPQMLINTRLLHVVAFKYEKQILLITFSVLLANLKRLKL